MAWTKPEPKNDDEKREVVEEAMESKGQRPEHFHSFRQSHAAMIEHLHSGQHPDCKDCEGTK